MTVRPLRSSRGQWGGSARPLPPLAVEWNAGSAGMEPTGGGWAGGQQRYRLAVHNLDAGSMVCHSLPRHSETPRFVVVAEGFEVVEIETLGLAAVAARCKRILPEPMPSGLAARVLAVRGLGAPVSPRL